MDLKETQLLEDQAKSHWYYASKAKAMQAFLPKNPPGVVLDVGAGSGFFTHELLASGKAKQAWCVDTSYLADYDQAIDDKMVYYRKSAEPLNVQQVLLMDVLEHVEDDEQLLRQYIDKVPSGCWFLITVPAFSFLWSDHDIFLEHKRRYTITQLESVVRNSGLRLQTSAYYFGLIFPLAVITRLAQRLIKMMAHSSGDPQSQLKQHHRFTNEILSFLCKFELLFFKANRIAGLSIFCLAQKP